ncbi:hypothetical protein GGF46_004190 [Coemansia sp. RSA 552]|nr:hypothetical protein GGF46_004190 [Coemansia sp. RSA 552]
MASRLLAWRLAPRALQSRLGTNTLRGLHTTSARAGLFEMVLKLVQRDKQETWEPASVSTTKQLTRRQRKGGYDAGGGMPLYVPIKAQNVDKAWEIWSFWQREASIVDHSAMKGLLLDFLALLVTTADPQDPIKRRLSAFRTATLLRHIVCGAVSDQSASLGNEGTALELGLFDLALGFERSEDYMVIIDLLRVAVPENLPSGNSTLPSGATAEDLVQEVKDTPIPRLGQALIHGAMQDGLSIGPGLLQAALEIAVAAHDVTAARDILGLCCPELACLLDPKLAVDQGKAKVKLSEVADLGDSAYRPVFETILRLIEVGNDPQVLDPDALHTPQQDLSYKDLDGIVDYGDGQIPSSEMKAIRAWRTAAAERIYRTYISAGIAEVPAPDNGAHPALQGSAVPTPQMIASLLTIYLDAGNVEQAAVYYEVLQAAAAQLPLQSAESWPGEAACPELGPEHRIDSRVWAQVLRSASHAGQAWLSARVLGDMAADGWEPSQAMYWRHLDILGDATMDTLKEALDEIRSSMQANGISISALAVREPLVRALVAPHASLSIEAMASRIEEALRISGLSSLGAGDAMASAVSDDTAREIISALIAAGQISRAQELADAWSVERPALITGRCLSELIMGLGRADKCDQALELFANVQQADEGEITLEVLCAVLDVYMCADNYVEVISVGKRIRALVASSQEEGVPTQLPDRDTYNSLILAHCENLQPTEALRVLEEMRRYGIHATAETYAILAYKMSTMRSMEGLKLVSALVNVDYNMEVIGGSGGGPVPTLPLVTDYYNALIEAHGRTGEPHKALQVWEVMRFRGVRPDELTATLLIDTCAWDERVHWEEDMVPQKTFQFHNVPEGEASSSVPMLYMHHLGNMLEQLQQAGLELSVANYQHLAEALIKGAFLNELVDMLVKRFEDPADTAVWNQKVEKAVEYAYSPLIRGLANMVGPKQKEGAPPPQPKVARFMDHFAIEMPVCEETITIVYGGFDYLRNTYMLGREDDLDSYRAPISPSNLSWLHRYIAVEEERLDAYLKAKRPELLPASRRT